MNIATLKKLIAKVPDDTEIEVHLDLLDGGDPIIGFVKKASLALDPEKESVFVIEADDASPEGGDQDDDEEE
jgi:hypothetical protein